jgi:hypothetical protein
MKPSPRTPLGPSDTMIDGMPSRSIPGSRHESIPESSDTFSSLVSAARTSSLRDARDRWRTLGLAGFLARAVPLEAPQGRPTPAGPLLAGLSGSEQSAVTERAGHVREVLTGYRSGTAEAARPGEPRPDYDPARPLGGRQKAKARELGVSGRTIRRWTGPPAAGAA